MRHCRLLNFFVLPAAVGLFASSARAQTPTPERPTPLPALGRSVIGNSDSTAMVQNPANIAFLPAPELRYNGYFLGDSATVPTAGHAFGLASPVPWLPLATGLRFDMVTPPSLAAQQMYGRAFEYQWLTWALAAGTESASVGVSFQRSFSDAAEVHGFGTWSAGLNLRPADYFGMGGVVRNVDAPLSSAGVRLGTEYVIATALRPLGSDRLEIGLEGTFIDQQGGYWQPRATLDVGIGTLGHLRGDFAWTAPGSDTFNSSWVASTALVLNGNTRAGSGQLAVGSRYGSGLGDVASDRAWENLHADAAIRGFRETFAAENLSYAVRLRLEETPSARGHVRLLRKLWAMAEYEDDLQAVLLEIRAQPAKSLAHMQELADAVAYLKQKGKKVLCHLESATGTALVLCSQADQILINPAGTIRYGGLKTQSFYIKGLLDKLGISADFVRIGQYKSAPEMFVRRDATDSVRQVRKDLIQQIELELSGTLARGLDLPLRQVREAVKKGPYTAAEAEELELVDGFAFDDMLENKVEDLAGQSLVVEEGSAAPRKRSRFGPQKRVAVVYVEGNMIDGRSQTYPLVGIKTVGSYTIAETLEKVRQDPSVGAVVLRVESGGGSAMAADVIWRELRLLADKKPVVVSMGAAAASGGYYISSAGSYVYANPLSITGSIGVFFSKVNVTDLFQRIGVNVETLRTTKHADASSMFRPFSNEEREILKDKVQQFYGMFLQRVAEGRDMTRKEVDAVGRGRVWTGRQAIDHNLVDGLGGLRQALAKARVMGGVPDDAPILELPEVKQTLLGRILGVKGISEEMSQTQKMLPQQMMDAVRAVAPYALYESDQPLARIEVLPQLLP